MDKTTMDFMVIDDDSINNHICRKSIEIIYPDSEILTFTDPQLALDYIETQYSATGTRQTILFLDINMPLLSGWDVLQIFMKFPDYIKSQFKIYILSSSVATEDKEKADKCSLIPGFVEKPLTPELLTVLFPN